MKNIYFLLLSLLVVAYGSVNAGEVQVGPSADGGQVFNLRGCTSYANVLSNVEGFTIIAPMETQIVICGEFNLVGKNGLDLLLQVTALMPRCLTAEVNPVTSTVTVGLGTSAKQTLRERTSTETFSADGVIVLEEKEVASVLISVCATEDSAMEEPYSRIFRTR